MAYIGQEITIEPGEVFGKLTVFIERACDRYRDDEIPFLQTIVFGNTNKLRQQFMDQEFTDILIKVIAPSGAVYWLVAHRVVPTAMAALKDRMKNGDQTIELRGIDPRCFLHLVAYAYTSVPDAFIFGHVILSGEDDTNRHSLSSTEFYDLQKKRNVSAPSGETDDLKDTIYLKNSLPDTPTTSIEEKLFQVCLYIATKRFGLPDILKILQGQWMLTEALGYCKCSIANVCPLTAEKFDRETWLEYFRLTRLPEALTIVFKEVPQFAQDVVARAQGNMGWDQGYYLQLQREQEMKVRLMARLSQLTS
ncbi:hypothetical protein EYR41_011823 [Orbilia oligospora]|uniref:BTB domain-containing protein n=1 Tax=Orbilia oligospora TaxID=2813651 RepID=A0A8H2DQA8_ORBOL|nr:hypothetical protein EYR41_011823 [Orbilia oligospora]